jgi:hypothetical protein
MAKTYKPLLGDDIVNTRTLLHEAIPITGTISSGTYQETPGTELNIKTFSHGMFESVYDYPYLSSSANHIFDITYGISSNVSNSIAAGTDTANLGHNVQQAKKLNIYNQMAQVLFGYDVDGNVRKFESDGLVDGSGVMDQCFFINFSRLLTKDEVKKGSFRLTLFNSGTIDASGSGRSAQDLGGGHTPTAVTPALVIGDYGSATEYRTCPVGDYGIIYTSSATPCAADSTTCSSSYGLIFYQAGIVVLTSSLFLGEFGEPYQADGAMGLDGGPKFLPMGTTAYASGPPYRGAEQWSGINTAQTASTIEEMAAGFRHMIYNIEFNNTIELNSAIYFCRVNHNEFNYSAHPTYVQGSKIVVKNNVSDLPLSYITSIGLYSPDNELLAVAKLSEPIRKDPNTELTLRVRLDY